jgi:DNA-binding ferritin-like protein
MSRFDRHARAHERAANQLRHDADELRKAGDSTTAKHLEQKAQEQDKRVAYYRGK